MCSGATTLAATEAPQQLSDGSGAESYSNNAHCEWTISAPTGRLVELTFTEFDVQWTEGCSADYVQVHDDEAGSILLQRTCGSSVPSLVLSMSSTLRVVFHSDSSGTAGGFVATYRAVATPGCRGAVWLTAPAEPEVLVVSDGATEGQYYANNLDCTWHISAAGGDPDQSLVLAFHFFDVPGCSDVVQVHDGPYTIDDTIGQFCGQNLPAPVFTSGPHATVRFRTDGSGGGRGFRLFVAAVQPCSGRTAVMAARGIVTDGNGGGGMPAGTNCDWTFDTGRTTLLMHSYKLPCGSSSEHGLTLFSGASDATTPLQHWCGDSESSNLNADSRRVETKPNSLLRLTSPGLELQQASTAGSGFDSPMPPSYQGFVATFASGMCHWRLPASTRSSLPQLR